MINSTEVKDPQAVEVAPEPSPVRRIDKEQMKLLGGALSKTFTRYSSDRHQAEQKWLRNLRQYLGIYDPEIEASLGKGRSRAYPRLTRVKCISVVSRIMNLMFPGTEKNWQLAASPSAEMKIEDVHEAVARMQKKLTVDGQQPPQIDEAMVQSAVNELAADRAKHLEVWIEDQLEEIGGDQTLDYVSLNRQVLKSGVMFGLGLLHGPFVRADKFTAWGLDADGKTPVPRENTSFKPMYEFLSVWDFYPDMSAKTFPQMDGYFLRKVMSRAQLRELANRSDYFGDVIKSVMTAMPTGNYKAMSYETLLRNLGVRENVSEVQSADSGGKYDVRVWHGPISGTYLAGAGVSSIPADKMNDDFMAEVWLIDEFVIKCEINSWRKIGIDVNMIHPFVFDEDDTSPVGNGLPNIMRDSQMSICAATRMMLDNASVICGPNLEINTDLMRPDQDLTSIEAYKIWYREGTGQEAQYPAVRPVTIDGHLAGLLQTIELFQRFADSETFVGPATGGDNEKKSSEPMRSAVGASMMRSDAALPFKDIVRSFDSFTMSVIYSIVQFNKKFNPQAAPEGDYNVVARGATSMIAKEIRGMQLDQLVTTLTDEEKLEIDPRKLARARFLIRDLDDILLPDSQAEANRRNRSATQAEVTAQQKEQLAADIRKTLSDAFKNIAQGQKNTANADAATVKSVLELLERGLEDAASTNIKGSSAGTGGEPAQAA